MKFGKVIWVHWSSPTSTYHLLNAENLFQFTGLATSSFCFCASISWYLGSLSNDIVARLVSSHPLTKVAEDEPRLGSIEKSHNDPKCFLAGSMGYHIHT